MLGGNIDRGDDVYYEDYPGGIPLENSPLRIKAIWWHRRGAEVIGVEVVRPESGGVGEKSFSTRIGLGRPYPFDLCEDEDLALEIEKACWQIQEFVYPKWAKFMQRNE